MSVLAYSVYNLLLWPAVLAALSLSLIQPKRRSSFKARLGLEIPALEPGGLWVHCLSMGEVISARPLLDEFRRRRPGLNIWLSSTTTTGLETARGEVEAGRVDEVLALPLDLAPIMDRLLNRLRPSGLVIVETDLWPNLIRACRRRNTPVALVNFRISANRDKSHQRLRWFFRAVYKQLDAVALPTELDQERFQALGLHPPPLTRMTGSLKYDQSPPPLPDPRSFGLAHGQPVFLAGSTHSGEEEIILQAWSRLRSELPDLTLILAPRDRPRFPAVARLIQRRGFEPARLSRQEKVSPQQPILLIDALGRLSQLYGLARVAFIGGSLVAQGGHNPLEAAAAGRPVLFGPHMEDFLAEANRLVESGGGMIVQDADSLAQAAQTLLSDEQEARQRGRRAAAVFLSHKGAAKRTADLVGEVMGW